MIFAILKFQIHNCKFTIDHIVYAKGKLVKMLDFQPNQNIISTDNNEQVRLHKQYRQFKKIHIEMLHTNTKHGKSIEEFYCKTIVEYLTYVLRWFVLFLHF